MTIAALALAVALSGCHSGRSSSPTTTSTPAVTTDAPVGTQATTSTTASDAAPLTVLVTNDDGYAADGIDTIVEALRKLPNLSLTVVAPSKNQSGTGGRTSPGQVTASHRTTKSGFAALAVDGFPADTITYALAHVFTTTLPQLVVSGINNGQNIGPFIGISGTVGVAEAAAGAGIPAIAVSSGFGVPPAQPDYAAAAQIAIDWVTSHRDELAARPSGTQHVVSVNVPTCPTGSVRGVKQLPAATALNGRDINAVDCTSTVSDPKDDVDAFIAGFATVTVLDTHGATVTPTTQFDG